MCNPTARVDTKNSKGRHLITECNPAARVDTKFHTAIQQQGSTRRMIRVDTWNTWNSIQRRKESKWSTPNLQGSTLVNLSLKNFTCQIRSRLLQIISQPLFQICVQNTSYLLTTEQILWHHILSKKLTYEVEH